MDGDRPGYDVRTVAAYAGRAVCVRLEDGTCHRGWLRTEVLSERSLSVYLAGPGDEGATLYIDQIVAIVPLPDDPAP